jgi:hypothetical protein
VLAGIQCRHGDHRVQVIRRRDDDGVDIFLLLEHAPVIAMAFHLRKIVRDDSLQRTNAVRGVAAAFLAGDGRQALLFPCEIRGQAVPRSTGVIPVGITQGDDVVVEAEIEQVDPAHAADADAGDVQPVAGRREAAPKHVTRHDRHCRRGADCRHELASRNGHGNYLRVAALRGW